MEEDVGKETGEQEKRADEEDIAALKERGSWGGEVKESRGGGVAELDLFMSEK